jgi:hypothetical protein
VGVPAALRSRGLVALEDGLGLQVVLGHPGLDRDEAERILLAYAGFATGLDLASIPLDQPAKTVGAAKSAVAR